MGQQEKDVNKNQTNEDQKENRNICTGCMGAAFGDCDRCIRVKQNIKEKTSANL